MNDIVLDLLQATTLYRIGTMLMDGSDQQAVFDAIALAVHELTGSQLTVLALLDDDGSLARRSSLGSPGADSVSEWLAADERLFQAIRERRPVLIPDVLADTAYSQPELLSLRTLLVVPLLSQTEPLGVVAMAFTAANAIGPEAVAVVDALATQAAASVRNVRDRDDELRLRAEGDEIARQFAEQANELERVQQQLIQNEKLTAIGQLVHGLAHEMNTPLSVVVTNLSVLSHHADQLGAVAQAAQDLLPDLLSDARAASLAAPLASAVKKADLAYTLEDLPDLLTDTNAATQRIAELVRSMAQFARRDTAGPTVLGVQDLLEAALAVAATKSGAPFVQVVREYAATPPVLGLQSELRELFMRLLINADQAVEDRTGTVTVGTSYAAGRVVVNIRDTGCGIPEDNLARVFDPFFTTHQTGGGTGMGLAVCHGIVTRHGGSIALQSKPGEGTSVIVSLPSASLEQLAA